MAKTISSDPTRRPGRSALLSVEQCRQIAGQFDGTTETIDRLLTQWREEVPGLQRHNLAAAARRGGYTPIQRRKAWTESEDQFLRDNWHRLTGAKIAVCLGRTLASVTLRHKRLGIARPGDGKRIRARQSSAKPEPQPCSLPVLQGRVSAQDNPFLSLLGWSRYDLSQEA
jgi:hypothetical protein